VAAKVPVTSVERFTLLVLRDVPSDLTTPAEGTTATVPEAGNVAVDDCPVPPFAVGRVPVTSVDKDTLEEERAVPLDLTTPEAGTTATVPDVGNEAVEDCPVPPLAVGRVPVTSVERDTLLDERTVPLDFTTPEVGTTATVPEAGNVAVEERPVPPRDFANVASEDRTPDALLMITWFAVPEANLVRAKLEMEVADCVPVTSPPNEPVNDAEEPDTSPVTLPMRAADTVPAEKLPEASLATMAEAVFKLVAVVAELLTFPAVEIVANFVSTMPALADTLELSTEPGAMTVADCVPVTSPLREPVKEAAEPDTFPVTFPVSAAVTVLAVKFPEASRATMAEAVLEAVAVVAELGMEDRVFVVPEIDLLVTVADESAVRISLVPPAAVGSWKEVSAEAEEGSTVTLNPDLRRTTFTSSDKSPNKRIVESPQLFSIKPS
jgi:hypothetical protein